MLDPDSLTTDGLGRPPATERAALLLEKVEPAELGLVIPAPADASLELMSSLATLLELGNAGALRSCSG